MSTAIARILTVFAVLVAVVASPMLAYAGGPAGGTKAKPAMAERKAEVRAELKAMKFASLAPAARAHLARAKMGGMSVAGNAAFAIGTGALAFFSATHGEPQAMAIMGGVAAYNTIQALRKWKAERAMNK